MREYLIYSDASTRIELYSDGTGGAMIEGEYFPVTKDDFHAIREQNQAYGNSFICLRNKAFEIEIDLSGILKEIEKPAQSISQNGSITADMLPTSISRWVEDICERIESPFEIGTVQALCFIGNLIGSKVGIRPKQFDNWTVTPNLWGMVIGKPSIKKTPVYSELYKSIGRLERQADEVFLNANRTFEIETELYEIKLKEAKKIGDIEALSKLKEHEPKRPRKRRYTTQDGTIEAITGIIEDNPNGLLITRDELSGWLKQMDKVGREGERSFYLEGWNGTNSFSVDRVGRGSIYLPRLTLGVLGNIQPSIIKEYIYEAVRDKKADGFLQRFQLTVFVEPVEQKLIDRIPNKVARDEFDKLINYVAKHDIFEGAERDEYTDIPFYRFDKEAQKIFNEWYLSNDKEAKEAFNEALEGHLSKYPKLFASLALIFHVSETEKGRATINPNTAKRALNMVNALKEHAYKLYSTFEVEEKKRDDTTDKIMIYLADKALPVKFRDVTHNAGGKPTKDEIIRAIKGVYQHKGSNILKRY